MKKIISVALILCMLIALAPAVVAADTSYVALGDSVALGSGLENPESERYSALLAAEWGTACTNLAEEAMTSAALLEGLQNGDYDDVIKDADVVTLGVGLYDIAPGIAEVIADALDIDLENADYDTIMALVESYTSDYSELMSAVTKIQSAFQQQAEIAKVQTYVDLFAENWNDIIDEIKDINPDAEIIAVGFYNILYDFYIDLNLGIARFSLDFRSIGDTFITMLENAVKAHHDTVGGYKYVNIRGVMDKSNMTNTQLNFSDLDITSLFGSGFDFEDADLEDADFNPNAAGHLAIANEILRVLPEITAIDDPVDPVDPESGLNNFTVIRLYTRGMFTDVKESDWYGLDKQGVIKAVYEIGLMEGIGDNKFSPDSNLNIAQAITMACRVHDIYNGGTGEIEDIVSSTDAWYNKYVNYAIMNGIINYGDFSNADMGKEATRAETAYIFAHCLPQSELGQTREVHKIPDVNASTAYCNDILALYKAGVLGGGDAIGTFYPTNSIKRGEAAAIVVRLVKVTPRQTNTIGSIL